MRAAREGRMTDMRIAVAGMLLAGLFASPSPAQTSRVVAIPQIGPDGLVPGAPEQITKARSLAQALIAKGHAQDYFEDITDNAFPAVRHPRSGIRCMFTPESTVNAVMVFAGTPARSGDDVGCNTSAGENRAITVTLYASRYRPRPTLEAMLDEAVQGIRGRYPDAQPYVGSIMEVEAHIEPGGPAPAEIRSARFRVIKDGMRLYARASVAMVGEWMVKLRISAPIDDALAAEALAALMFPDVVATVAAQD
jgi:hypothetical protein